MKYLIFSDESGRWNDGEYYIRSWIRITSEQYKSLRKEVIFAKYETKIKELKWNEFVKHYEEFKSIFSFDFEAFITISKLSHFETRKYDIINKLSNVELPTVKNKATIEKIRGRIIYAVKQELFFNYFEKQHIENSFKALLPNPSNTDYEYKVDKPQYKQWRDIAKECGISNVEIIEESENEPGIELADVVSGCIKDFVNGDSKAAEIYGEHLKPKMSDMYNHDFPNPNLIFYGDFSEEENNKLNIFR